MPETVVRVAVPTPLRGGFDYLNACTQPPPVAGARVRVPFGRRQMVGVVTEVDVTPNISRKKLRAITEVLDTNALLDAPTQELLAWIADYYHRPIGESYATALPVLLRQGEPAQPSKTRWWKLSESGKKLTPSNFRRAPRQQELFDLLQQYPDGISDAALRMQIANPAPVLKRLEAAGVVQVIEIAPYTLPTATPVTSAPQLNNEQSAAVAALAEGSGFHCSLLEGITGSGKTEIYLALAQQAIANGKQCLVLVPEIGLTPQLIARFSERLGQRLAVLHSGLNNRERLDAWLAARSGDAAVVLGTRSAVLTPLQSPGLIIVDEEHDSSYKQQDGLRYSARDVAVRRAQLHNIAIVLGSATPSLESLQNALLGRYKHLRLHHRAGAGRPPKMRLVDVRSKALTEGLSPPLIDSIGKHLDAGGQVLLFLNRRGFAPALMCHDCGWVAPCRRCDTGMTSHRGGRYLCCHHCGARRGPPQSCENCSGEELVAVGEGTERIAGALRGLFPNVPMARFDRDTLTQKGSIQARLKEVAEGKIRLLVGTQMLAKGHDFPNLTLVGVVNCDHGLFSADFRAFENMAQLVTQVAGRAGRGKRAGEVLLQTRHPDHPLLNVLMRDGYHAFARAALTEREHSGLPPHGFLALLRAESPQASSPPAFLDAAAQAAYDLNMPEVELWGPVPAPMERRAGRIRWQLLLRAEHRNHLHRLLRQWIPALEQHSLARKVRWAVDVDPQDLM